MQELFLDRADWVLSGGLYGWDDPIVPLLDFVVFIQASTEIRVRRLREREARHFGADAIAPGGWRHRETEEFIDWASHYDDGTREGRSLDRQLKWLERLRAPVIRLDGARATKDLVGEIVAKLPL